MFLLFLSRLSKRVSVLITRHVAAFLRGFWWLPFHSPDFFSPRMNSSKSKLTVSGALSRGQTWWKETKRSFRSCRQRVWCSISVHGRAGFREAQTLINVLLSGLCFHQVSHHPPISACHAESGNFVFWQGNVLPYFPLIIFCDARFILFRNYCKCLLRWKVGPELGPCGDLYHLMYLPPISEQ